MKKILKIILISVLIIIGLIALVVSIFALIMLSNYKNPSESMVLSDQTSIQLPCQPQLKSESEYRYNKYFKKKTKILIYQCEVNDMPGYTVLVSKTVPFGENSSLPKSKEHEIRYLENLAKSLNFVMKGGGYDDFSVGENHDCDFQGKKASCRTFYTKIGPLTNQLNAAVFQDDHNMYLIGISSFTKKPFKLLAK